MSTDTTPIKEDRQVNMDTWMQEVMKVSIEYLNLEYAKGKHCALCANPIRGFKDKLSLKEHELSGLCQECQDDCFSTKY